MKGFREIRRRLRAVQNTAKVTRAMQLVASSKMRSAQRLALSGRCYAMRLAELASKVAPFGLEMAQEFFCERPIKTRGIILISTNKGLCGSLNANLFRQVDEIDTSALFIAVGKKGAQYLASRRRNLLAEFSISDRVQFHEIQALAKLAAEIFIQRKVDTIEVLFPLFINTIRQVPFIQQLLPMATIRDDFQQQRAFLSHSVDAMPQDDRELLIEPSHRDLLQALSISFFRQNLYHFLLEAKAAEQSARMVAMKTATDNAQELARALNLEYNKARQTNITNEILEITAGIDSSRS